ncbi:hypothetical protein ACFQRL_00060 [Microbacterium fluvii]|uniref:Uncharacterized protein n=2 Tax=Microbacterium fluvii TaxID=415215 RepID=A0ABW2H8L1_9MICO
MADLEELVLGGASAVTDLRPLARLSQLKVLDVENGRRVLDYSPLGGIPSLRRLAVGPSISGSRTDAESVEFLRTLPDLDAVCWDPRVRSLDYSPFLTLTNASMIALRGQKGMTPSLADLEWALPGMQAHAAEVADEQWVLHSHDGSVAVLDTDITGRRAFREPTEQERETILTTPFATKTDEWEDELRGAISGTTIRTLGSTARTRTEKFWVRVESPERADQHPLPLHREHIVGKFAFVGSAEGPLLIWDSPIASEDDPTSIHAFFTGNVDAATSRPEPEAVDDDDYYDYEDCVSLSPARALVRVEGTLRERVVLVDLERASPGGTWSAIVAAFTQFGGEIVAGPELGPNTIPHLPTVEPVFWIRRRSNEPEGSYLSRYGASPQH